jgi:hypothetical protein
MKFFYLLAALVAVASPAQALAPDNTITGHIQLVSPNLGGDNENCWGRRGFSDLKEGARVSVRDEAGKLLALGALRRGQRPGGRYQEVTCEFPFAIEGVPNAKFYSIEIERRGSIDYSLSEIRAAGWNVTFIISPYQR